MNELVIDLDHLDHTIRLIDPGADASLIEPKQYSPAHASFKNEMPCFVMAALRNAKEPVTSLEIAREVVTARGLDVSDRRTVTLVRKHVDIARRLTQRLLQPALISATIHMRLVAPSMRQRERALPVTDAGQLA